MSDLGQDAIRMILRMFREMDGPGELWMPSFEGQEDFRMLMNRIRAECPPDTFVARDHELFEENAWWLTSADDRD